MKSIAATLSILIGRTHSVLVLNSQCLRPNPPINSKRWQGEMRLPTGDVSITWQAGKAACLPASYNACRTGKIAIA